MSDWKPPKDAKPADQWTPPADAVAAPPDPSFTQPLSQGGGAGQEQPQQPPSGGWDAGQPWRTPSTGQVASSAGQQPPSAPGGGMGLRVDGTPKGMGWLGPIKTQQGDTMTELSFDFDVDGRKIVAPLLVPTLSSREVEHLKAGGEPTQAIYFKAQEFAMDRLRKGMSPFVGERAMPMGGGASTARVTGQLSDLYATPLTGQLTTPQPPSLQRSVGVEQVPASPVAPAPKTASQQQLNAQQKIAKAESDIQRAILDIYHRAKSERSALDKQFEEMAAVQDRFVQGTPQWDAHQRKMGELLDRRAYVAKREQDLQEYAQEEMNSVIASTVKNSGDSLYMVRDGVGKVADPSRIQEQVDKVSERLGIQDEEFRKNLYNKMLSEVDMVPLVERANEIAKAKIEPLLEREQQRFKEGFKSDEEIFARATAQIDSLGASVKQRADQEQAVLLARANEVYASLTAPYKDVERRYEQAAVQIQQQIDLGAITYEQGKAMYEQATAEYNAAYAKYQEDWKTAADSLLNESSRIAARYNQQYQQEQRRIIDAANKDIEKAAEQYAKEFQSNPEVATKIKLAYKSAWSEATNERSKAIEATEDIRRQSISAISPQAAAADVFFRSTVNGLGGAFKGISTTIGSDTGYRMGEEMERAYYMPKAKSSEWSDLLDPLNFAALSGQLAGAMAPSLVASAVVAKGTGGLGAPAVVQMVTSALAGWGAETSDIAGRAKEQVMAQTGDIEKANEAWDKSFVSQVQMLPAYSFEGLPFVSGMLSRVPTVAGRVTAGAGIEYVTEMFQELPQNAAERNILEGKEAWDDFAQGILDPENKEILISMAPVAILGGGGQITSKSAKSVMEKSVKDYVASKKVSEFVESAPAQWMAHMTNERGANFAQAVLASLHQNGTINEQQLQQLEEMRVKSMEHIENARRAGLNQREATVYAAFAAKADDLRTKAQDDTNPVAQMIAKARLSEVEKTLRDFVTMKEAQYVEVTYADPKRGTTIMDIEEARRLLSDEGFIRQASLLGLTKDGITVSGVGAEGVALADFFANRVSTTNDRIAATLMDPARAQRTMVEVRQGIDDAVRQSAQEQELPTATPKGTPETPAPTMQWEGEAVEAEVLKPDPAFLASNSRDADIGRVVTYQGVEGVLAKNDDGYFLVTPEEDIVIEGGLSDATNEELGLTARLTQPEITLDLTEVEVGDTGVDPNAVLTDFGDGRIAYRGSEYTYVRTNLDNNDNEVSVTVLDSDGKEKTIRNKQAVEEIVLQKMLYEDWAGKQPTTNEITEAAAELGLEERAPVPAQADKERPRKVQPKKSDKTAQAPAVEAVAQTTPEAPPAEAPTPVAEAEVVEEAQEAQPTTAPPPAQPTKAEPTGGDAGVVEGEVVSVKDLPRPPFRDWRVSKTYRGSVTIVPNRVGGKFTDEQIDALSEWAKENGLTVHGRSPTKLNIHTRGSRSMNDFGVHGAAGVALEAASAKKAAIKKAEADRDAEEREYLGKSPAWSWAKGVFGEDAMNTYNAIKLADFLDGKDKRFGGLVSRRWVDGLKKLNALPEDGQPVDFQKIKDAYSAAQKEIAAAPAKPADKKPPTSDRTPDTQATKSPVLRDTPADKVEKPTRIEEDHGQYAKTRESYAIPGFEDFRTVMLKFPKGWRPIILTEDGSPIFLDKEGNEQGTPALAASEAYRLLNKAGKEKVVYMVENALEQKRKLDEMMGGTATQLPGSDTESSLKSITKADVRNMVKALAGLFPNAKVITPKTPQEYANAVKGLGKTGIEASWGLVDFATQTIYVNPASPNKRQTLFHEGAHPVLAALASTRPDLLNAFAQQLADLPGGEKYKKYGEQYEGSISRKQQEMLAEFLGDVASGKVQVSTKSDSPWQKFKQLIRDILDALGFGPNSIDLSKPADVRQFAAEFKKAMEKGLKIEGFGEVGDATTMLQDDADRLVGGWYSRLDQAVAAKGNTQSGADWMKWAEARAKEGLLSMEEVKWTGLADFLQGKAKVTPKEVREFLKENRVKVEVKELADATDEEIVNRKLRPLGYWVERDMGGDMLVYDAATDEQIDGDEMSSEAKSLLSDFETNNTKFSQHQLPGGTNYREVLVTLPPPKPKGILYGPAKDALEKALRDTGALSASTELEAIRRWHQSEEIRTLPGLSSEQQKTKNIAEAAMKRLRDAGKAVVIDDFARSFSVTDEFTKAQEGQFRSSHFDEPNILVHLRLNDRTGPNGEKILFIEELQSDFGQSLRKLKATIDKNFDNIVEKMKADGVLKKRCP